MVAEVSRNDDGVKVLYRMIAYIREEAVRLHIMDVAILLNHAEQAVVACAPSASAESVGAAFLHEGTTLKH